MKCNNICLLMIIITLILVRCDNQTKYESCSSDSSDALRICIGLNSNENAFNIEGVVISSKRKDETITEQLATATYLLRLENIPDSKYSFSTLTSEQIEAYIDFNNSNCDVESAAGKYKCELSNDFDSYHKPVLKAEFSFFSRTTFHLNLKLQLKSSEYKELSGNTLSFDHYIYKNFEQHNVDIVFISISIILVLSILYIIFSKVLKKEVRININDSSKSTISIL
eukprot:TRINITY_DN4850_c0_g1_i1.p1 TRINITY_DN4850_c0_g1~~TRINITY_DN4850_c0_g1_i1.p1  ORF type:complete len:234 (+),score=58.18 TRINITY_DN4850_c0_g1_i1:30-704(+)